MERKIKTTLFVGLLACSMAASGLHAEDSRPLVIQDKDMLAVSIAAAIIGGGIGFFGVAKETHYKTMDDEIVEVSRIERYFKKLVAAGFCAGVAGGGAALALSLYTPAKYGDKKDEYTSKEYLKDHPKLVDRSTELFWDSVKHLFMGKKKDSSKCNHEHDYVSYEGGYNGDGVTELTSPEHTEKFESNTPKNETPSDDSENPSSPQSQPASKEPEKE